jgi:phosphoenolpyruvate carboxylase
MELSATINLLGRLLGDVISELESPELLDLEERIRQSAKDRRGGEPGAGSRLTAQVRELDVESARAVAAAFTAYFDLVNLAEEANRVRSLRVRERVDQARPESLDDTLATLKRQGVSAKEIGALLGRLRVELVLTAHPTEAKRRTVLSKLQRISRSLRALYYTDLLPRERESHLSAIKAEVVGLWLTNRNRTARPAVTDEVRTNLYFIDEIFWRALPRIERELSLAVARYYPSLQAPHGWLTLASWVGGDRDGNPNVTAAVTAETLRLHRGLAVERHRETLADLARRMSFDVRRVPATDSLRRWIESRRPFPAHAAYLEERYGDELYRLALSLLAHDLEAASRDDMTARLLSQMPHEARARIEQITGPLDDITAAAPEAVTAHSGLPYGDAPSLELMRQQLDIFGLQAARLDLREDSARLVATLSEILRALDWSRDFGGLSVAEQVIALTGWLQEPRPAGLSDHAGVTVESSETWALFRLIARVQQVYGPELLGPFIISMTRSEADILIVMLLAHWAGCTPGMQVAPLFETIDDLQAAPRILERLFALDLYRQHLAAGGGEQMVMIGYSDSNKDGGYLAANWALYEAQEAITTVCAQASVPLTIFHGRGGTVARGGGPANRAIRAQPPGTVGGRFRVTEQGEVIASRYADPDLAHRHLEQVVSAVLLASASKESYESPRAADHWRAGMKTMAEAARSEYRSLVYDTPGFIDFWRAVTPIDEISTLRIGSRPTARRGGGLKPTAVRAIPWVFSWMQSRFNLPGWYGLGTGLTAAPIDLLREMYRQWPFFRAMLDNAEMSLLKADMDIAALYVELADEVEGAQAMFARIRAEFDRTQAAILSISGQRELMSADTVIQRSIILRNPYVDPLNFIQVEMLKRLRAEADEEASGVRRQASGEEQDLEALRDVITLTINGIAAGLRNTG